MTFVKKWVGSGLSGFGVKVPAFSKLISKSSRSEKHPYAYSA